jgi:hypothetical protein
MLRRLAEVERRRFSPIDGEDSPLRVRRARTAGVRLVLEGLLSSPGLRSFLEAQMSA